MVKAYWKVLPALHVPNTYGKLVPLRHPMVKPYPPRAPRPYLAPLAYLAIVATLRGVCFYHRVPEGVPFYHSSMVEKLLAVGLHNRSRTLPGMTRFDGAPVGPTVAGTANPNFNPATESPTGKYILA